jgi:hypothetical protein
MVGGKMPRALLSVARQDGAAAKFRGWKRLMMIRTKCRE